MDSITRSITRYGLQNGLQDGQQVALGKLALLFCAVVGYGILVDDLLPSRGARYRVLIATRTGARTGQAGPSGSGVRPGLWAEANLTRKDGKPCD